MEELESLELTITPDRPTPRPMVYADLSKMVYLNAVIKVRHCSCVPSKANESLQYHLHLKARVERRFCSFAALIG